MKLKEKKALAEEHARLISLVNTIAKLENLYLGFLFTEAWHPMPQSYLEIVEDAVQAKSWELVEAHPKGHLVPRIEFRKRSMYVTYKGQVYKCGAAGNAAGERWQRASLIDWVHRVGGFRLARSSTFGSRKTTATGMVDWIYSGLPHRALKLIRGRKG